ncbi:MAG: alanine racemase [Geminicoccaceae bacterium]
MPEAALLVDLDAIAANYARLRAEAGGCRVAGVVKADAYGLGAERVAGRLWAAGCEEFFVARLAEGVALRRHVPEGADLRARRAGAWRGRGFRRSLPGAGAEHAGRDRALGRCRAPPRGGLCRRPCTSIRACAGWGSPWPRRPNSTRIGCVPSM